ncbi:serine/threonine-protein kinase fray2 [Iris pallida]|uniref:Serine/threonine-protein kinase fray2 n=1 Tax=Iris pallida TaxID=29817 RepID=A0AAX6HZC9_IRIPA|nr:serine/threonine-protein kinase fray2 [Iris pallida]
MPSTEQEALSQSEYQRGVSAWNFDVDDLKVQASMIHDDEDLSEIREDDGNLRLNTNNKDPSASKSNHGKPSCTDELNVRENNCGVEGPESRCSSSKNQLVGTDLSDYRSQEELDGYEKSRLKNGSVSSTPKQGLETNNWKIQAGKKHQTYSGPLFPSSVHNTSLSERGRISDRSEGDNDKYKRDSRKGSNLSGPLMLPNRASANSLSAPSSGGYGNSSEDKSKANVVQIRGRFSVTSENVDLVKDIPLCTGQRRSSQVSPLRKSMSVGDSLVQSKQVHINQYPKETTNCSVPATVLLPHLQNLFQQTSFQQDLIMNLLNSLQQNEEADSLQTGLPSQTHSAENDILVEPAATERERILLMKVAELQSRMISLTDELTAAKLKHIQLQEQLNSLCRQEEEEREEEMEEVY